VRVDLVDVDAQFKARNGGPPVNIRLIDPTQAAVWRDG